MSLKSQIYTERIQNAYRHHILFPDLSLKLIPDLNDFRGIGSMFSTIQSCMMGSSPVIIGPITQDGSVVSSNTNSGATITQSITIGSNPHPCLFAICTNIDGQSVSSVKIGSTNFTKAVSVSELVHNNFDVEIWYLTGTAGLGTGSQSVVVTFSGANVNAAATVALLSLYNVNQSSPIGATNTANGNYPGGGQPSNANGCNITPTNIGSWILDGLQTIGTTNGVPTASLTQVYNLNVGTASYYGASQYSSSPTISSSNAMAWSGLTGNIGWSWCACEIKNG